MSIKALFGKVTHTHQSNCEASTISKVLIYDLGNLCWPIVWKLTEHTVDPLKKARELDSETKR